MKDWALRQDVADSIFELFGQPDVDMMATRESSKTERFWGWRKDPCAEGIDSLIANSFLERDGFSLCLPSSSTHQQSVGQDCSSQAQGGYHHRPMVVFQTMVSQAQVNGFCYEAAPVEGVPG